VLHLATKVFVSIEPTAKRHSTQQPTTINQ